MEKVLSKTFGLNIQEITYLSRHDTGNDNELFKIITSEGIYFLKEIPSHSEREDIGFIYSELAKSEFAKSRIVLPLTTLEGKFLVEINEKSMMLYDFIHHKVLNEVDIEVERILEVLGDLFSSLEKIEIPQHPFKNYNNWFERGVSQLRKKVSNHKFLDLFENYTKARLPELDLVIGNTHFDLNPFNIWLDENENILISDFDNAQVAAYAKDIFDACSKFVTMSQAGIKVSESDLDKILKFSKKYISNIDDRDIRFLLTRPKLGYLFDPKSNFSEKELTSKMDDFYEFCNKL